MSNVRENKKKTAVRICDLYYNGLSCTCTCHMPFSERFMTSLLDQLEVDYVYQPSMKFLGFEDSLKKYDFYIPSLSLIIEMHGRQHYELGNNSSWTTLEEQQKNDAYKKELAIKNGIQNYIAIDCRHSTMNWVKNSIMNSQLPDLFNFTENDIDWVKCTHYVFTPLMKQICDDYHRKYMTIKQLTKKYNLNKTTINRYLRIGNDYGWCTFGNGITTTSKPIEMKKDGEHLLYGKKVNDLVEKAKSKFGITLYNSRIWKVLNNGKTYNSFNFYYVEDINLRWKILKDEIKE